MHILVTGGTGVVGEAAVRALLRRGHRVRLLARRAEEDARVWPAGVEAWPGDVTKPESLRGAADGCDAVLHLVGIVDESPPHATYQAVNVDGTRHVVEEATRAGAPHLVYVSSLGADRGASPYHRSKFAGEEIARGFAGRWVIVRSGNVYGPGDEVISLLLKMVRTLPAIPVIAGGDQPFQPLWADDVGEALAVACERDELAGRALDLAGPERTTMNDLLDRFASLTGHAPVRLPMPGVLAKLGLAAADAVGVDLGINQSQLTMLAEGNVVEDPGNNALGLLLDHEPVGLGEGLRRLLDSLPEQLPEEGRGMLHHKRYWADIDGARVEAGALFARFLARFHEETPEAMDLEAEPGTPTRVLALGQTVTMTLPLRGTVQVRVAELTDTSLTLQTVAGHPLAGAVRFTLEPRAASVRPADAAPADVAGHAMRFTVEVFDRSATWFDALSMGLVGGRMQRANWQEIVETIVEESGGTARGGVQSVEEALEGEAVERVEAWLRELAVSRRREENARAVAADDAEEAADAVAPARERRAEGERAEGERAEA